MLLRRTSISRAYRNNATFEEQESKGWADFPIQSNSLPKFAQFAFLLGFRNNTIVTLQTRNADYDIIHHHLIHLLQIRPPEKYEINCQICGDTS